MADDQGSAPSVPKSVIEVTAFMPEARRDPHPPLKALRALVRVLAMKLPSYHIFAYRPTTGTALPRHTAASINR